jgi:hypothetical protein
MRIVMISRGQSTGSFAVLWLMARKQPGKICRQAAVSPSLANQCKTGRRQFPSIYQDIDPEARRGMQFA